MKKDNPGKETSEKNNMQKDTSEKGQFRNANI